MKKSSVPATIAIVMGSLLMIACAGTPQVIATSSANMNNLPVALQNLGPGDYAVIGQVSGTGQVTRDAATGVITGDTLKYGYLGKLGDAGYINQASGSKSKSVTVTLPGSAAEIAEANATFALIEDARSKGADAVIFVTVVREATNSGSKTAWKVTVQAIAIAIRRAPAAPPVEPAAAPSG